jgi:YD repeat-containing protein
VFAQDPTTAQIYMLDDSGNVSTINPTTLTSTAVQSGLSLSGSPQSMAITYVGGEQRFIVATTAALYQVHAGGSIDELYMRGGNSTELFVPSHVTARNDLAVYTEGNAAVPVLYRIRLSTPPGTIEALSAPASSGNSALNPSGVSVSDYSFYGPAGVAYTPTGSLYVADTPANSIYMLSPDESGEIGPTSVISHVLADGAGRFAPEVGTSFPGVQFPVHAPSFLSTSPDGTLLIGAAYGVAAYDPVAQQAEWLSYDNTAYASPLAITYFPELKIGASTTYTNLLATGPRSFWFASYGFAGAGTSPILADVSKLASDRDPTRTLTFSSSQGALVDTTNATVDSFDVQGRLVERDLRTGEPIMVANYLDATSDRVSSIVDPDGNATSFAYDSTGRLSTITDPASRQTVFGRDGFGDLRSISQPDGEVMTFTYDGHHMTSKTARGTDTTLYTYNADGTLSTATKPAGETTNVSAALSKSGQYLSGSTVPVYTASYVDAHGVTHAVVTDAMSQIQGDVYTADGVTYTKAVQYAGGLTASAGEPFGAPNTLLRIADTTLNGVRLDFVKTFDTHGRVIEEDFRAPGVNSAVNLYSYDANGWLTTYNPTQQGVEVSATRDAVGHLTRIVDVATNGTGNGGAETDLTWRTDGQPATVVRDGVTYSLSYDDSATKNLNGISDSLGRTASFTYDPSGNVQTASDGATTTTFDYDGNNRMLVSADALGNQTTFGYTQVSCGCTENDEVTTIHTPDLPTGQQWSLGYSAEGRLATVADPDGFIEAYGYEPTGEINSIIDRNGNPTNITHDHLGRALSIIDALGRTHAKSYAVPTFTPNSSQAGLFIGPTLTSGSASATPASTSFAASLNPGDYQIGHAMYQGFGLPPGESFYRDATFDLPYALNWDSYGRLSQFVERTGQTSSTMEAFDGNGSYATVQYDNYTSQVTGFGKPGGGSSFSYDKEYGATGSRGFALGGCTGDPITTYSYTRDAGSRITETQTSFAFGGNCGSPPTVPTPQTYAYYPNGKLQTYSGPDGTKAYTYDARGLVKSLLVTLPGGATELWGFTYDNLGRSLEVTYPDGHVRAQVYDDEGRTTSRCYNYGSQGYCYTASYDPDGNPLTTSDPYGGSEAYVYDALKRLTQVTRTVAGSTEHVETYTYNLLGALHTSFDPVAMSEFTYDDQRPKLSGSGIADSAIPNTLGGQPVTRDAFGEVTGLNGATFTFDVAHRPYSSQFTNGSNSISEAYRYDASLRRIYRGHTETSPAINTSEFYAYDGPGSNVLPDVDVSGADTNPGFDPLQGTTRASLVPSVVGLLDPANSLRNVYSLDTPGRALDLLATTHNYLGGVNPTGTSALVDNGGTPFGSSVVAILQSSGALSDAYLFDSIDHPLRLQRGASSYFYEVDLAGNVRRLRDATGADLGGYRYTAFGSSFAAEAQTPAATINQPLLWKGRPFLNVAGGVYDMRNRWWSPQMTTFLNLDEYQYHDPNSTLWGWPGQNPVRIADPYGRGISRDQCFVIALVGCALTTILCDAYVAPYLGELGAAACVVGGVLCVTLIDRNICQKIPSGDEESLACTTTAASSAQ